MPQIIWTEEALADLERIYQFLLPKDPEAALDALTTIDNATEILQKFPKSGRLTLNREPQIWELIVKWGSAGYVLLYNIDKNHVYILACKHQKEAGY